MTKSDSGVKAVISRMKEIYRVEKDAELARALDISPQTLSSWRQRSAVPYALCVECAKTQGASLDWLLYGEGHMMRTTSASPRVLNESRVRNPDSAPRSGDMKTEILNLLEDLPEEDLEDILNEAEHRKRLRVLEQRFENLQAQFFGTERKLG